MYVAPLTQATPDPVTTNVSIVHAGVVRRVGATLFCLISGLHIHSLAAISHSRQMHKIVKYNDKIYF